MGQGAWARSSISPRVAELLGHLQRHGLHALEHDGDPHHARYQDRGEDRAGSRAALGPAHGLADLGEHVEEDEAQEERLHERADHEFDEVLPEHDQVAQHEGPQGDAAGRHGRADRPGGDVELADRALGGRGHQSRSSLPVRLMNTVSSVGSATDRSATSNPWLSAADTTRGKRRVRPPRTCSSRAPSVGRTASHLVDLALEHRRQLVLVAGGLHRDDGVGVDALLQARWRVERQDLAVVHDGHPAAQLVGLLHVVGGEHDRLPLGVEHAQDVPQRQAALGVQTGRRLIHEEHGRSVEDRPGHHEALGHTARQGVDRRLAPLRQLELLEQLVGRPT